MKKSKFKKVICYQALCPECGNELSNGDYKPHYRNLREARQDIKECGLECDGVGCDFVTGD